MKQSDCQAFLEDPLKFPDHLESCESCRLEADALEKLGVRLSEAGSIEPLRDVSEEVMETLPVAPWEGANHRAWILVFGGAGIIVLLAAMAFSFLGISPVEGFVNAISNTTIPRESMVDVSQSLVALVQGAPRRFHVLIGISFVIVNIIFFLLLRRSPRGYDASSR